LVNSITTATTSIDHGRKGFAIRGKEQEGRISYETGIEKTYPHNGIYRVNGFPKNAFHIAFISHKTRLQNILRASGIDPIEKALLKQRFANLSATQAAYNELQKKVLL